MSAGPKAGAFGFRGQSVAQTDFQKSKGSREASGVNTLSFKVVIAFLASPLTTPQLGVSCAFVSRVYEALDPEALLTPETAPPGPAHP